MFFPTGASAAADTSIVSTISCVFLSDTPLAQRYFVFQHTYRTLLMNAGILYFSCCYLQIFIMVTNHWALLKYQCGPVLTGPISEVLFNDTPKEVRYTRLSLIRILT